MDEPRAVALFMGLLEAQQFHGKRTRLRRSRGTRTRRLASLALPSAGIARARARLGRLVASHRADQPRVAQAQHEARWRRAAPCPWLTSTWPARGRRIG